MNAAGIILLSVGGCITLINVYLSVLRYPLHRARDGGSYRWVSGIPVLGSLLLWISIGLLPSPALRWIAGIVSVMDTGGIHWFIGTMWWTGQLGGVLRGSSDRAGPPTE